MQQQHVDQRWPWFVVAGALWTLAAGLAAVTCVNHDLFAATASALTAMIASMVTGLVAAERLFHVTLNTMMPKLLHQVVAEELTTHRAAIAELIASERVRIEDVARQAARVGATQRDLPRNGR